MDLNRPYGMIWRADVGSDGMNVGRRISLRPTLDVDLLRGGLWPPSDAGTHTKGRAAANCPPPDLAPPGATFPACGSVIVRSSSEWLSLGGANFCLRVSIPILLKELCRLSRLWVRGNRSQVQAFHTRRLREMIPSRKGPCSQMVPVSRSSERIFGKTGGRTPSSWLSLRNFVDTKVSQEPPDTRHFIFTDHTQYLRFGLQSEPVDVGSTGCGVL